jgi:hypothetical protein
LLRAFEENRLDPDLLDSAVKKIVEKKSLLTDHVLHSINVGNHQRLSQQLSQKSITLFKDSAGILPLKDSNISLIMSGDNSYFGSSILNDSYSRTTVDDAGIFAAATIVVAVFTSVFAWRGTSGIGDEERDRLRAIIKEARRSVVISFGSPYVLRHFDDADVLVAAYEPTIQAQQAALNCLAGKVPFTGKLPVNMPGR